MKILQRNLNRSTFVVWEMKCKNPNAIHEGPLHSEKICVWCGKSRWCIIGHHLLRCNHHNSCIYGNFQHFCKSTGRYGNLNWMFPAGWSDIPHFTHASMAGNSVIFLPTASFRRDFGHRARPSWHRLIISYGHIWKGECTKTNHEPQTPWKQTSPKKFRQWQRTYWQGLCKIWRAGFNPVWTKWWPLPAHVMISSRFLHNEASPLQISLQYSH